MSDNGKPAPDYFLTNRKFLRNDFLMSDQSFIASWFILLASADRFTGIFDYTKVGRVCRKLTGDKKWRAFAAGIKREGMIEILESENGGRGKGRLTTARIVNWERYQGEKTDSIHRVMQTSSKRLATDGANSRDPQHESTAPVEHRDVASVMHTSSVVRSKELEVDLNGFDLSDSKKLSTTNLPEEVEISSEIRKASTFLTNTYNLATAEQRLTVIRTHIERYGEARVLTALHTTEDQLLGGNKLRDPFKYYCGIARTEPEQPYTPPPMPDSLKEGFDELRRMADLAMRGELN